jgi:hypothetical protein
MGEEAKLSSFSFLSYSRMPSKIEIIDEEGLGL